MSRLRWPALFLAFVVLLEDIGCSRTGQHIHYETTAVVHGDLEQRVTASGTVGAVVSVEVGSQVSGKISVLNADFNSEVHRGQLIAEIDPSVYAAALKQAQGELASARANARLKAQNLERKRILAPLRAASQLDLDQATAELTQAQATVLIKEAALESARANLGYCKITSPVEGTVIARKVDLGQTVVAAMQTPVLFTIAQDITKMHISAAVSEADIGQVKVGQQVDFSVDAFPDEVFHGAVAQVRRAATTTSNVVTYETIIDFDNPDRKLFPGMTADVAIRVACRSGTLKVSNAALRYTPPEHAAFEHPPPARLQGRQRLAYSVAADGVTLSPVVLEVGIADGVDTEVIKGAIAGTRLVTSASTQGVSHNAFSNSSP